MSVALFQKNNVITESACGNRFLFQGREYDYDTALYYFRARWYEPETGRWLSPDPIGISGGLNLYAFCGNDPVNQIDPIGLAIVRNNTPWPIVVSGGLGKGRGHDNPTPHYAVIPPGSTGGGEYPLPAYSTPAEAINAYINRDNKSCEPSEELIYDVDFYHDYAVNLKSSTMPPIRRKLSGTDTFGKYNLYFVNSDCGKDIEPSKWSLCFWGNALLNWWNGEE